MLLVPLVGRVSARAGSLELQQTGRKADRQTDRHTHRPSTEPSTCVPGLKMIMPQLSETQKGSYTVTSQDLYIQQSDIMPVQSLHTSCRKAITAKQVLTCLRAQKRSPHDHPSQNPTQRLYVRHMWMGQQAS